MSRGRSRDVDRALVQPERFDQHVQLFAQPRDRKFGAAQTFALGTGIETPRHPFVGAHDRLQWLPQIMAGHGQQYAVEVVDLLKFVLALLAVPRRRYLGLAKFLRSFPNLIAVVQFLSGRSSPVGRWLESSPSSFGPNIPRRVP
jgi:hypothetical protein